MNAAREEVLRRIRDAVGESRSDAPITPRQYAAVSKLTAAEIVERFADRVDDYHATVHLVELAELPARLRELVGDASRVAVPADFPSGWLGDLDVVRDDGVLTTVELERLDVVITGCAAAIAETGTVILDGSAGQGRRAFTLVPDHHVCIVPEERIHGSVPEALAQLVPTRPITLISGPSATSDIELDRVEGVHGPRRMDVIIVVAGRSRTG